MRVSRTATIQPGADIDSSVIVEGDVTVGAGTRIGPYCYLRGPLVIGRNNRISSHVIIGEEPEHRDKGGEGAIRIGDNNVIRELTIIHRGTGERMTEIGNGCYLMDHIHVSHDSVIGDSVTLAHNTVLAGHTKVLDGATTGIATVIHQWSVIGSYAMTGMGSVITRDIPPFSLVKGNPAKFSHLNKHVFSKLGIATSDFVVENGELQPRSSTVKKYFEEFNTYSKRAKIIIGALA